MNRMLILLLLLMIGALACLSAPLPTAPPAGAPGETAGTPAEASTIASPKAMTQLVLPVDTHGLKIAFVLNGNVWSWTESTGARQLSFDGDAGEVHLSSDGAVIVYQRGQALWAFNFDGSSPRLLVDVAAFTGRVPIAQFDFQPISHMVYFSTYATDGYPAFGNPARDLNRVDSDAPAPQNLLAEGGGIFIFSPDGNLIALAQTDRINVIRVDGSALITALAFPKINTGADWPYVPQVVWLADSTGFYTVIPAQDIIANPAEKSRFLYVAASGEFHAQLAEFVAASVHVARPLIAPNGSKLAYVSQEGTALLLHVIDASTADAVVAGYPNAGLVTPWAWSPDSNRFAFWARDPAQIQLTGLNLPAFPLIEKISAYSFTWIDANTFLYFADGNLRLGQVGTPNLLTIASDFAEGEQDTRFYDFAE